MKFAGTIEKKTAKRIKISDDELLEAIAADKDEAERYFEENIADNVVLRYQLLRSSQDYYGKKFRKLSELCDMTSSDIRDAVEWIMPSLTTVYMGADKIVGIFGRTADDNPEALEKLLKFQMNNQNEAYKTIDQWIRDALESGLGVIRLDWERIEEEAENQYYATAEEFYGMESKSITNSIPSPDGSFLITVKEKKVSKNQPVLRNVKPGEYIFLPSKNREDRMVFECQRKTVLYGELLKEGKLKGYKNLKDIDFRELPYTANAMQTIADAMQGATGQDDNTMEYLLNTDNLDSQEARKQVLIYDCYGMYDVDKDGLLENVHAIICGDRLIFSEINEDERSPFFHMHLFPNSYQEWKEGVADYLQEIQDLKTALVKQIVINTTINNDRSFAVDVSQPEAMQDLQNGMKIIRCNLRGGKGISDFIYPMPKYELSPETFNLIEMANTWGEAKTGVTRYNQGLNADSLNKTATGISKIMAASQQRLQKMARDGAESGLVPLYKHLICLNKKHLDKEFTFRITNEYFEFQPDDIKGDYDVEVTSNIGLQDKQLVVQNLMLLFTQILPNLMQQGAASPAGLYETARQIIENMGFTSPDRFIGLEEGTAIAQGVGNSIVQQLPQMLMQLGKQLGLSPEQASAIAQNIAQGVQGIIQQQTQNAQSVISGADIAQQAMRPQQQIYQTGQTPEQSQAQREIEEYGEHDRRMLA